MDNMECQLAKTSIWLTKAVTVLFHMIAGKISTSLCSYWPPSDFDRLKHTFPRFANQRMSVAARCLLHLKDQSTYSVVNNPVCKVPKSVVPFTAGLQHIENHHTYYQYYHFKIVVPKVGTKSQDQNLWGPGPAQFHRILPPWEEIPTCFRLLLRKRYPKVFQNGWLQSAGPVWYASSCQIPSHHVTSVFFFPMVETIEDCHLMKTDLPVFWDQPTN